MPIKEYFDKFNIHMMIYYRSNKIIASFTLTFT